MITLVKYTNRKIYSPDKSAYVTLAEVANYVKTGTQFQVIEKKTRADVTAKTLQAIVAELVVKDLGVDLLQKLIQLSVDTEQEEVYTNTLN